MTDDQKRAIGVGAIGLVGLFLISRRSRGGATRAVQPTTGSVAPYTPQAPLPIAAGESVYDPNNQALLTTPTGFPPSPQASTPAAPGYTVNVTYPKPVTKAPAKKKPTKRKPTVKKKKPAKKKPVAKGDKG